MNYCKKKKKKCGAKTFILLNPLKDSHLIGSAFKWKFKAWTRSCSGSGGLSPLRWISTCAELHKACTPVSVLLEMTTDTSFTGFSFRTALYTQKTNTHKTWWSCYPAWFEYSKRHLVGLNRSRKSDRLYKGVHMLNVTNLQNCIHISHSFWNIMLLLF